MNRSERLARPSRVAALDGVRGLLALLVVAWHTTEQVGVYWLQSPAKAAVAIFFVLSGYVLTRGWDRRFGVFLVRRFVRLWPVYALCLGVGSILAGIQPAWTTFFWYPCIDPHSSGVDPPNWSLFLEAWTMPFMPLIVWSGSGSALRAGLVMVGAIAAGFIDARITVGAPFVFGAFLARAEFRNPLLEFNDSAMARPNIVQPLPHALAGAYARSARGWTLGRGCGAAGGFRRRMDRLVVGRTAERSGVTLDKPNL